MLQQYLNDSLDEKSCHSFQEDQVNTSRKSQIDCQYCMMKKKFNLGKKGVFKCFQHSVAKTDFQVTIDVPPQNEDFIDINEMVQALEDVQEGLNYYWDHLKEVSKGNPTQIQKQLQPVYNQFKKVQQKMSKFFFQPQLDTSEIQPVSQFRSSRKKYQCAGSQKFYKFEVSDIFDPQEQTPTDCIKEWVAHFYKILHTRNVSTDDSKQLPLQQDLQMRIFKESMERKFLSFGQQFEKGEKKIQELLQKLIFYMQKSEGNVPPDKINEDITFLQMQSTHNEHADSSYERMLFVQASTIQFILNSCS